MNFSKLDRARRSVGPLENNLIDSYAAGAISRRTFVTRGSVLGLGVAFMGTIIAACGSDEKTPAGTTGDSVTGDSTAVTEATGSIKQGGTLKIAAQKPAGPLDPVAMANLGTYTPVVVSFEYLVNTLGADLSPMLAESWKPNDDGSVWTFNLRKGVKWHDGKDFTSADVVATMDRLAGSNLKAYITAGSTKAIDANTVEITLLAADGQFPYQVGPYNP
ncbi:MAG: ABC transporter substrate-binding protein, partial [Actinobacteria bacterium]|nr:ABC transporter substrate-binding protein [Actinomycetota bacterium]